MSDQGGFPSCSNPNCNGQQLKFYQAFTFATPIIFTLVLLLLFCVLYVRRRQTARAVSQLRAQFFARGLFSAWPMDHGLTKSFRDTLPTITFDETFAASREDNQFPVWCPSCAVPDVASSVIVQPLCLFPTGNCSVRVALNSVWFSAWCPSCAVPDVASSLIVQPFCTFPTDGCLQILLHLHSCRCAVCLGDYQLNEKLQQLPLCEHVFHVECIDEWLASNATCPICRTSLLQVGKLVPLESLNTLQATQESSGGPSRTAESSTRNEAGAGTEAPPTTAGAENSKQLKAEGETKALSEGPSHRSAASMEDVVKDSAVEHVIHIER